MGRRYPKRHAVGPPATTNRVHVEMSAGPPAWKGVGGKGRMGEVEGVRCAGRGRLGEAGRARRAGRGGPGEATVTRAARVSDGGEVVEAAASGPPQRPPGHAMGVGGNAAGGASGPE